MPRLTALARFAFLALLFLTLSPAAAEMVQGSDPRAKPMKDALAGLIKQITAGDLNKAKAQYAGEKADLDLLKAYVDAYGAAKAMRAQLVAKFGNDFKDLPGFDLRLPTVAVADYNSVIFDDNDPNRAATSAGTPLGVGIEFKRVSGQWKVLSLASAPGTPENHLARLRKYIPAVQKITDDVKAGKYKDPGDAADDAEKAQGLLDKK